MRRSEGGTRPHAAEPGEYYNSFDGKYGGTWRRVGYPPQALVGVGMSAQGFERATYFRRTPPRGDGFPEFLFEGIEGDIFGDRGLLGGGASGWEIDRYDPLLGSPTERAFVLASSEDHDPSMLRTVEELLPYIAPFKDRKARSDVVVFARGGGLVFSVGSMTWMGALATKGGCARTQRLTRNVIDWFLSETASIDEKGMSVR